MIWDGVHISKSHFNVFFILGEANQNETVHPYTKEIQSGAPEQSIKKTQEGLMVSDNHHSLFFGTGRQRFESFSM